MRNKNVWIITAVSLGACILHAAMLHSPINSYLYTSFLKVAFCILAPLIYFKIKKENFIKNIFAKGDKKYLKLSLALGFGTLAVMLIGFLILRPFFDDAMIVDSFATFGITQSNFIVVFIYVILINALMEEIFFRGFVFMTLHRLNVKRYAHIYSALLFSVYHVTILSNAVSPAIFVFFVTGLAASGLLFNFLTIKCKNIIGSQIVHVCANIGINLSLAGVLLGII
ncbi:MAG: CPBP family intramembrane metalloprotease [Clostridiales bacterium]|jgi:membrane protease YdiL (CAAX protease family)|nr:CPBP family intramembrane metalloprotease [Clostridiales bacterium]